MIIGHRLLNDHLLDSRTKTKLNDASHLHWQQSNNPTIQTDAPQTNRIDHFSAETSHLSDVIRFLCLLNYYFYDK